MTPRLKHLLVCCVIAGLLGGVVSVVRASQHGSLKLFRLNLHHQLVESADIGGDTGCRNFLWPPRAYRVTQRGFAYCELYTRRNCQAESAVNVLWLGSRYRPQKLDPKVPQPRILPGTRWQLHTGDAEPEAEPENTRIVSRRCVYEAE